MRGTVSYIYIHAGKGEPTVQPHLSNTYDIDVRRHRVDYLNQRPDGGIVVHGGKGLYEDNRQRLYHGVAVQNWLLGRLPIGTCWGARSHERRTNGAHEKQSLRVHLP